MSTIVDEITSANANFGDKVDLAMPPARSFAMV